MKCSRCGSTVPNPACFVCWEEPAEGEDCFSLAKEQAFNDDEDQAPPLPTGPYRVEKCSDWDGTD